MANLVQLLKAIKEIENPEQREMLRKAYYSDVPTWQVWEMVRLVRGY